MIVRVTALALIAAAASANGPATRKVWADEHTNLLGGLSPDGKLLSYVEPATGDLAIYELAAGRRRTLTRKPPGASTFAYFSAFSRDSRSIAYAWFNEQGFYELWTVSTDGGEPRKLYSNPENGFVQPCDWSLDGSQILTLFFRKDNVSQIALVSARDGSVRVLKTLSWFYPKKISFSPDGRYILYDSLVGRDEAARDILLLAADGSAERKLVEHPANDIFPLWAPGGGGVIFASDRAGQMDLWLAPVRDGEAAGEPRAVARSLGRALPIGIAPDGAYYFGLRAGRSDVQIAESRDDTAAHPQRAGRRTAGRNSAPDWSADGRRVAYLTQLGTENYGQESRGVTIWAPESRQETRLTPQLASIERIRWAPDDALLLVSGSDGRGRSGLFTVNPETAETAGVVRIPGGGPRGLDGVWLDARTVAHVDADGRKIVQVVLDGDGAPRTLFEAPAGAEIRHLAADPRRGWLACGLRRPGAAVEVRALPLDGGTPRAPLALDAELEALELFGGRLYATVAGAAGLEVWSADLAGGAPRKSALPPGPRFSADGKSVAYVTSDQREEVWALEGWLPAPGVTDPPAPRR